jgi:putative SOS response-associated peptidase YedK
VRTLPIVAAEAACGGILHSVSGDEDWSPRYNIAPTQLIPVIRQHPKEPVRELSLIRWGLIPSWAKDASVPPAL